MNTCKRTIIIDSYLLPCIILTCISHRFRLTFTLRLNISSLIIIGNLLIIIIYSLVYSFRLLRIIILTFFLRFYRLCFTLINSKTTIFGFRNRISQILRNRYSSCIRRILRNLNSLSTIYRCYFRCRIIYRTCRISNLICRYNTTK